MRNLSFWGERKMCLLSFYHQYPNNFILKSNVFNNCVAYICTWFVQMTIVRRIIIKRIYICIIQKWSLESHIGDGFLCAYLVYCELLFQNSSLVYRLFTRAISDSQVNLSPSAGPELSILIKFYSTGVTELFPYIGWSTFLYLRH